MTVTKGFTLIEVMVVIMIVTILAAVAVPIMYGRIDSAKWAEAKGIMDSIATGLRSHVAEEGSNFTAIPTLGQLGFSASDMDGTYFKAGDFSWVINNDNPIDFLITATAPSGIRTTSTVTLDHSGKFTYY